MSHFGSEARKYVQTWQAYNHRRWRFEKDVLPAGERAPFVCECTDETCLRALEMTLSEFESAHMCPTWTVVIPGHLMDGDGTRVLAKHPSFWVVGMFALTAPQADACLPREAFVNAARASDRSQASGPPEPPLPRTADPTQAELHCVIAAAKQRSPTAETGQAG